MAFVLIVWVAQHSIWNGDRLPDFVKRGINQTARLPGQIKQVTLALKNHGFSEAIPDKYLKLSVEPEIAFSADEKILVSEIDSRGNNVVKLLNLSGSVEEKIFVLRKSLKGDEYTDKLEGGDAFRQAPFSSQNRIWSPLLWENGYVTFCYPWNDIITFDPKTSREIWRIRGSFHHSIEFDHSGNIWVCGSGASHLGIQTQDGLASGSYGYEDQILVKISREGKILSRIKVSDLLLESGLEYLMNGPVGFQFNQDPLHLNQISPILNESKNFKKGWLLVSLRNISTILLVDPDDRKVVWHKSGPWINQHSVFQYDDSRISLLDNHSFGLGGFWLSPTNTSRIVVFDPINSNLNEVVIEKNFNQFFKLKIEGRAIPIGESNWLLEDSMAGSLFIIRGGKIVFKYTNRYPNGSCGVISWCRYVRHTNPKRTGSTNEVPKNISEVDEN